MRVTKTQKLLLSGLNQFNTKKQNRIIIMMCLEKEDDQLLMIDYLLSHQEATEQDIMSALGDILKQRKKINELKKQINEILKKLNI